MARSSLESLPPAVLGAVHAAIERGASIDSMVELITGMGEERSRSSVGRYSKQFVEVAKQQRSLKTFAEAFGRDFGEGRSEQRLMTQVLTSVVTRALIPIAEGEEVDLEPQDLNYLASAVKHAAGAAKVDVDRELKVREEERRRAKEQAANDADTAGRAAGASEDTLRRIRAGILGLAA